jgi:deoxyribose-phosphate aldolase
MKVAEREAQASDLEISYPTGFDARSFAAATLGSQKNLAAVLDHTLLKPDTTREQIVGLCEEAAERGFACVIVNPGWASVAHAVLAGSGVRVGTVIGFPLGAGLTVSKRDEARELVKLGARELEMMMNLGMLRSGMNAQVEQDIRAVVQVARDAGALVKVILETCLLSVEEKLRGCELAIAAGADFLTTSTGLGARAATADDVALVRGIAGGRCGVKAAGGIRTLKDGREMLEAGASRIGSSACVRIIEGLAQE